MVLRRLILGRFFILFASKSQLKSLLLKHKIIVHNQFKSIFYYLNLFNTHSCVLLH